MTAKLAPILVTGDSHQKAVYLPGSDKLAVGWCTRNHRRGWMAYVFTGETADSKHPGEHFATAAEAVAFLKREARKVSPDEIARRERLFG